MYFAQKSSIYDDIVWLDSVEKLELCFRKGTSLWQIFKFGREGRIFYVNTELQDLLF